MVKLHEIAQAGTNISSVVNGNIATKQNVSFNRVGIYGTISDSDISGVTTVGYVQDYVQKNINGLDVKDSVRCATTANIDFSWFANYR